MEWWQILLIIVGSILVGLWLAALATYLVKRFVKKPETTLVVEEQFNYTAPDLVEQSTKKREATLVVEEQLEWAAPDLVEQSTNKREATLVVEEQLKWTAPNLVEEVENNLKIATEPWAGKLLPFQTHAWSQLQEDVDRLPANLLEELGQIYIDIRLANNIARLATEFNHRSRDLDESYMKLCTSIAERLDRIKPLIERLREP